LCEIWSIQTAFPKIIETAASQVPRGNTCRGVNERIGQIFEKRDWNLNGKDFLDLACGEGEFLRYLAVKYPEVRAKGADRQFFCDNQRSPPIAKANLEEPFRVFEQICFDFVICISGVMEFDNTLQFFRCCREHLKPGGYFLVTNDNVATVRDRLTFFFCGKPRQFPLFTQPGQATWKILHIQNMVRNLLEAGFRIDEIHYTPVFRKDLLFIPIALLIYLWQEKIVMNSTHGAPSPWGRMMYPFSSLISRHYIIVCQNPQH